MLDFFLLRPITKIVFETRFRMDVKVEISVWGDNKNKQKVEALSNTL